jgi:GNAT superfamily N-acetyltransferase
MNNILPGAIVPAWRQALDAIELRDFCQDPETGLLCGSDPSGGSDTSSGGKGGGKPGGGKGSAKVDSLGKFREDKVKVATTSGENEKEFLEVWNSKIGMEPAAFKKDFLGGAEGDMTLSLRGGGSIAGPANRWLEITGKIKDGGKTVGDFHRLIDVQKNSAESAMFEMKKEAQGKGFGKKLLAGNIAMYREMGLKHVETLANIDVGGYAWAKYGYVPTRSAWSALKSEWSKSIAKSAPETQARFKAEVAPLLKSDPKAIWAVADSKWGKTLLLGRSWEGRLNLKDEESMGRFDAYVSKKSESKLYSVMLRRQADAPNGSKDPKSKEFFYIDDDGVAQDAELHNEILDEGDDEAAKKISDKVKARILGEKRFSRREDEIKFWIARLQERGIIK